MPFGNMRNLEIEQPVIIRFIFEIDQGERFLFLIIVIIRYLAPITLKAKSNPSQMVDGMAQLNLNYGLTMAERSSSDNVCWTLAN